VVPAPTVTVVQPEPPVVVVVGAGGVPARFRYEHPLPEPYVPRTIYLWPDTVRFDLTGLRLEREEEELLLAGVL
jgi:hypothetical protein